MTLTFYSGTYIRIISDLYLSEILQNAYNPLMCKSHFSASLVDVHFRKADNLYYNKLVIVTFLKFDSPL